MPGRTGVVLGMRSFGMSAPIEVVAEHFGFTVEHVVEAAKQAIAALVATEFHQEGANNAAWNDRPGADGRQHGDPADQGRP